MKIPKVPFPSDVPVADVIPVESMTGDDEEDLLLLRRMSATADEYIRSFPWCGDVLRSFFGGGVGGVFAVFLFNIRPTRPQVNSWIWIVVGDIPSAYLSIEDAKTAREVFNTYLAGMRRWVHLAKNGRSGTPEEGVPPVDVPSTPEWADKIEQRLNSLHLIVQPFFDATGESDYLH